MTRHSRPEGRPSVQVGTCPDRTSGSPVAEDLDDPTGDARAHQVWLELTLLLEPLRRLAERGAIA